jgi:hypothetical protein
VDDVVVQTRSLLVYPNDRFTFIYSFAKRCKSAAEAFDKVRRCGRSFCYVTSHQSFFHLMLKHNQDLCCCCYCISSHMFFGPCSCFKAGVSNSNCLEAHFLKKKFSAGHSLVEIRLGTVRELLEYHQNKLNLNIFKLFPSFSKRSRSKKMHLVGLIKLEEKNNKQNI